MRLLEDLGYLLSFRSHSDNKPVGLLDSEWVREVLGLSPNVGLEALAESLNIPEGSQDKDSLKVLTELPRSQSMKVLALLVGSLVIVVMKNEGATKELTSTTWERIMG
ncbi:unnamed protein product [Lactuca saligna]|uniref:Uncharacterized protein n=1 Tax=Lactuca saligna TaxID=75948 RepID=A0AA35VH61_LACSI|nr:unnamed protein product [Lactuca saligna]